MDGGGIEKIIEKIRDKFKPEKILLFGSRARGDYLKESDYDLIIVSKYFKDHDFRERIIKVYELIDEPVRIDVLCYTQEEFEEKRMQIGIVRKAVEEGIVI